MNTITRVLQTRGWPAHSVFARDVYRARRPLLAKGGGLDSLPARHRSLEYITERLQDQTAKVILSDGDLFTQAMVETLTIKAYLARLNAPIAAGQKGVAILGETALGPLAAPLRRCPVQVPSDSCAAQLWFSPQRAISVLHYDRSDAIVFQLVGSKRWLLFEPAAWRCLYPNPLLHPYPYQSQLDVDAVDYNRFPRFRNARRHEIVAEAGDVIFVPAPWWHQVYSLDDVNVSLHYRWDSPLLSVQADPCVVRLRLRDVLHHARYAASVARTRARRFLATAFDAVS